MNRNVVVECGVYRACAKPVGNGKNQKHPEFRRKRKTEQCNDGQKNAYYGDDFR